MHIICVFFWHTHNRVVVGNSWTKHPTQAVCKQEDSLIDVHCSVIKVMRVNCYLYNEKKNTLGMVIIMWADGPGQRVTHQLLTGPSPVGMWLISIVESIIYYRAYYTLHSSRWLWPTGHTPSNKRQGNSSSNKVISSRLQYNAVLDSSAKPASASQPLMTNNLSKAIIICTSISMNWRLVRKWQDKPRQFALKSLQLVK